MTFAVLFSCGNKTKDAGSEVTENENGFAADEYAFTNFQPIGDYEKRFAPKESVKKFVPEDIQNIDTSSFIEKMPMSYCAAGTFIVAKEDVSVKIYAGARADDERYYGDFTGGEIAVIENFYEYCDCGIDPGSVWYQICVLSSGLEGWIRVSTNENNFLYSCDETVLYKDSYTIKTINADIGVHSTETSLEYGGSKNRIYDSVAMSPLGDEYIVNVNGWLVRYDKGSSTAKLKLFEDENLNADKKTECAYSPDGKTIYIVNEKGELYSHSVEKGETKKIYAFTFDKGYYDYPWKVYVSPDERFIYAVSSIEWSSREDAMIFVYDRKQKKQFVLDVRKNSYSDRPLGQFSNIIFDENGDAYASTFAWGTGESAFIRIYLNHSEEIVYEVIGDGIGQTISYNYSKKEIYSIQDSSGLIKTYDKKGNLKASKWLPFGNTEDIFPSLIAINESGTLAAFRYYINDSDYFLAIYSLVSQNLLGVIKHDGSSGFNFETFSVNSLYCGSTNSDSYVVYDFDINEKEVQFDFSPAYDENLEELCGDNYTDYEFYGYNDERMYYYMKVKFYPNGFYRITSEAMFYDSEVLGKLYGTYEMNWPDLKLFTATRRLDGWHHPYESSDFFGLNLINYNYDDITESLDMRYDYDLKHNGQGWSKIECSRYEK